ncbi:hypothetical protein [Cyanothece sp. BG0011]|uniref:hypothetical protein n=1 Tax=Cyanothece sp. BG0011 TaxID=2082950 RepID=UPI000D1E1709|nr:hypothetical protein [Cyanothece sp. BG0011]
MKQFAVIATTHPVTQSGITTVLSRESLEKAAKSINDGHRPLLGVEHDRTIPPLGKILEAWVENRIDGQYQLVVMQEIFEETSQVTLVNGMQLLRKESETDRYPFANPYKNSESHFTLSYDLANFESLESAKNFINDIKNSSGVDFTDKLFSRRSAIPEPEFIINVIQTIGIFLISHKVIDKAGDKIIDSIMDDVPKFYALVKALVASGIKYAHPKNRPITYVFIVSDNPLIEFIVTSADSNTVMSAISIDKLKQAISKNMDIYQNLGAEKIQYLLNKQGEWEFNYLLTSTGQIIGTHQAYSKQARKMNYLINSSLLELNGEN